MTLLKSKTSFGMRALPDKKQDQKLKNFAKFEIGDPKIYILVDGLLSVEARDVYGESLETHQIRPGDAFGYSDYLKIKVSPSSHVSVVFVGSRVLG